MVEHLSIPALFMSFIFAWFISKKEDGKWWELSWLKFFAVLLFIRLLFILAGNAGTDA